MATDCLDIPGFLDSRDYYPHLERLQDDETSRAPEPRNPGLDGAAPELDTARLAPEVLPGTDSEVLYSSLPPEAVNVQSSEDSDLVEVSTKKLTKWSFVALTIFLVVALATGLGIGLWKKKSESLPTLPATVSPIVPPPSPPPPQQIINDTSLAATILANGDRHLFFQDPQGAIRRVIRTASSTQWSLDPIPIPILDARSVTPMAISSRKYPDDSEEIDLYYISTHDYLNSSTYRDGSWEPVDGLSNYSTAPNTRQLSFTSTVDIGSISGLSGNQSADLSLLLYENSVGNVSALLEFAQLCTGSCPYPGPDVPITNSYWIDISSKEVAGSSFSFNSTSAGLTFLNSGTLYETLPKSRFSPWFAVGPAYPINGSDLIVQLLICDGRITDVRLPVNKRDTSSCGSIISLNYVPWTNSSHGYFFDWDVAVGATEGVEGTSYSDVNDSDLAMVSPGQFAIWVNGTKPATISYNGIGLVKDHQAVPNASFPFKRLATSTSPDHTISYLYHQINGTTFAEEQYTTSINQWISSAYITIPNS